MSDGKAVLFLTTNDVRNPIRGCDRRSAQLRANLPANWTVDTISYDKSEGNVDASEDADASAGSNRDFVFDYPASSLLTPFDPRVFRRIHGSDRDYDVIVASAIGSVSYGLAASVFYDAAFVVDVHNVDHQLSLSIGDYPRYLFSTVFGSLALRRADLVVLTSGEDAAQFDTDIREKSIIVSNGFDADVFHRTSTDVRDRVLFFGNMSYRPNEEAVELVASEIAPALSDRRPDLEIHLAGPDIECVEGIVADCDNVEAVGFVDDIASYIRQSKAVIVPLETGSGTRLKIIEALACGTPVVSTPKGAEGWPDDWNGLVRASIGEFPDAIDTVTAGVELDDEEYGNVLDYSWKRQCQHLNEALRGLTRE